jgi:hypothetical protein
MFDAAGLQLGAWFFHFLFDEKPKVELSLQAAKT